LIRADWREALKRLKGRRFSLCFLDPPYRMAELRLGGGGVELSGLLAEEAIVVMEHAAKAPLSLPPVLKFTTSAATAIPLWR
jgi:16S rRNA G966 N2-methylase RsmD